MKEQKTNIPTEVQELLNIICNSMAFTPFHDTFKCQSVNRVLKVFICSLHLNKVFFIFSFCNRSMLLCLNHKDERLSDLLTDVAYSYYSYCNVFMIKVEITELANICLFHEIPNIAFVP